MICQRTITDTCPWWVRPGRWSTSAERAAYAHDVQALVGAAQRYFAGRLALGDQIHALTISRRRWRVSTDQFRPDDLDRVKRWLETAGRKLVPHGATRIIGVVSPVYQPLAADDELGWIDLRVDLMIALNAPADYLVHCIMKPMFEPEKKVRCNTGHVVRERIMDPDRLAEWLDHLKRAASNLSPEPDPGNQIVARRTYRLVGRALLGAGPRRRWVMFGLRRDGGLLNETAQSRKRNRIKDLSPPYPATLSGRYETAYQMELAAGRVSGPSV